MKLRLHRVEIPLEHPFTIARGTKTVQRCLIVELQCGDVRGYGEATEHDYYQVTYESLTRSLEGCRRVIESCEFDVPSTNLGIEHASAHRVSNPESFWTLLQLDLHNDRFAAAALDAAAHDLFGKLAGQTTFQSLGLRWADIPQSSYTIGIDRIDRMVAKLDERSDWPIFKIKLGTKEDVEIVRQLRDRTTALFRVDANCGWTVEETIDNSHALKDMGVEFIEQPLPAESTREQHRKVFENSVLPIIADESCLVETDVAACHGLFHGVNVKLSKCGGLTPGVRMLKQARQLGLKTMLGCMVESTIGISAAAQLLPLLDYADLDGAELLAGDLAEGARVCNGTITLAKRNGNGIELLQTTNFS